MRHLGQSAMVKVANRLVAVNSVPCHRDGGARDADECESERPSE